MNAIIVYNEIILIRLKRLLIIQSFETWHMTLYKENSWLLALYWTRQITFRQGTNSQCPYNGRQSLWWCQHVTAARLPMTTNQESIYTCEEAAMCNVQCIKQKIRMSRMSYNRQSITHNSESFTSLLPPGLGSYFQRSKVYLTYFTWLDLEALLTVCNKDFNKTSSLSALKYNWRIPALNVFNPQSGLLVCFLLANKTSVISDYRKCCSPLLQYRTRLWASLTGLLATHEAVLTGLMQSQLLLLLFLAPNCQYELVSCSNVSTFKTNHSKPTF